MTPWHHVSHSPCNTEIHVYLLLICGMRYIYYRTTFLWYCCYHWFQQCHTVCHCHATHFHTPHCHTTHCHIASRYILACCHTFAVMPRDVRWRLRAYSALHQFTATLWYCILGDGCIPTRPQLHCLWCDQSYPISNHLPNPIGQPLSHIMEADKYTQQSDHQVITTEQACPNAHLKLCTALSYLSAYFVHEDYAT